MDNFFEILIYLFIVVSFINSFLKKKKKKNKEAGDATIYQNQTKEVDVGRRKQEPQGKDILEEIQNLFNPPVEKPKEDNQEAFGELWKTDSYKEHYKKDEYHQPVRSEHEMVAGEHSVTLKEHIPTLSEHELPKVVKPEETIVTRLLDDLDDQETNYQIRRPNPFLFLLRKELKNKDLLKRYIVISEIIGKPKALRR